ncbi:MAG: DUF4238 domain-containing protein [Geobacteraceae bacterium]|nr:DUF4238 domain-containing protein [Geobacteraceae bacterium]
MRPIDSSTPKKQHYVPQFILKNFVTGKKKRVHVFDKQRRMTYASSVRDAACETRYYNVEIDGDGYTLEGKLSSLEGIAANAVKKIIAHETLAGLDAKELSFFHLFCAVQLLRTETQRHLGKQIQELTATWLDKHGYRIGEVENFELLDDEKLKHSHVHNINSLAIEFAEHFRDKVMMLVKAPRGCEFLISDNPITMYNHMPRPGRGNLGLGLDGIEIHMPLSRTLSVTYACPKMMGDIIERINKLRFLWSLGAAPRLPGSQDAEELVDAIETGAARVMKPENMDFLNSLQVIQSSRFLYSSDGNFSLIEDMLRTNPECQFAPRMESN